jgi:Uma2 family endonuclease
MSAHAPHGMSVAEFLEWDLRQDCRHEVVDGEARPMTGAHVSHDLVVGNIGSALRVSLRAIKSGCNVFSADIALVVPGGNARRPDLTIHCPPFDVSKTALDHPRLVVEVLSESTQSINQLIKLDEYRSIPDLAYILIVAPTVLEVGLWLREEHGGLAACRFPGVRRDRRIASPGRVSSSSGRL